MAAKYWRSGFGEYYRSLNKQAFTRALQKLVPEIQSSDLEPAGPEYERRPWIVRAVFSTTLLLCRSDRIIHVCNVPSPAATASLVIGEQIVQMATNGWLFLGLSSTSLLRSVQRLTWFLL